VRVSETEKLVVADARGEEKEPDIPLRLQENNSSPAAAMDEFKRTRKMVKTR
jgi:hypothetical protein